MRYLILFLLIPMLAYSDASDMNVTEVKPDVAKWVLDSVFFYVVTQTCEVRYRPVDVGGNPIGNDVVILFANTADNPATPEDETLTEFTQLIQAINSGSNIKNTIKAAVKTKLGITEP